MPKSNTKAAVKPAPDRKTPPKGVAKIPVKQAAKQAAKLPAKQTGKKVRYAVVGLGYFSQKAILPAFANAVANSELVALVSDDPEKLNKLGKKYGASKGYSYDEYAACLKESGIDAVYIALPNDMHREFAAKAAKLGIHVLCEKPMALSDRDCEEMIRAANEHHTRLMIAYRLHLEPANLKAIEAVQSGQIGDPRFFSSAFSMQVKDGGIRTQYEHGGGPVWDLGVYCINAARYLFRDEPIEVMARTASKTGDQRFSEVEEMASVILTFPGERQAVFTCSFGAADTSWYSVMGTQGYVHLNQAYDYAFPSTLHISTGGKPKSQEFPRKDQVAAELLYFSNCILTGKEPEPSGVEGLADVRVISAIYESAKSGRPVRLEPFEKRTRPSGDMGIIRPPAEQEDLFHAIKPTRD